MRKAIQITLTDEEQATLTSWARTRTAAVRLASRAQRVLLAAEGSTSRSWRNLIERWFREITTPRIRRGRFHNVEVLEKAIHDDSAAHHDAPKPFLWTADVKDILPQIVRAHEALDKMRYQ